MRLFRSPGMLLLFLCALSACLLAMLLAGCGDSGGSPSSSSASGSIGGIALTVSWPTIQSVTRDIPASATSIVCTVTQNGQTVGAATITRPATTGQIGNIPVGAATVNEIAKDATGASVASGSTTVTVVANQYVPATLQLTPGSGGGGTPGTNSTDGAAMVWVPGGSFTMGTAYGAWWNAPLTQQVTLSGYWIYKYDVTVAQYRAFCTATGYALPPYPTGVGYSWTNYTDWTASQLQQMPIVNVAWSDAEAYCAWAGVTLPTEAQWEYAARGPAENNYPWGGTVTAADPNNGWDQTKCANYYN